LDSEKVKFKERRNTGFISLNVYFHFVKENFNKRYEKSSKYVDFCLTLYDNISRIFFLFLFQYLASVLQQKTAKTQSLYIMNIWNGLIRRKAKINKYSLMLNF